MVSIEFHLRPSRKGADHAGSVYVRVIARRRTASVTLSWRLYPHEWDSCKKQVVAGEAHSAREKQLLEISREMERERRLLLQIAAEQMAGSVSTDLSARIVAAFKRTRLGWGLKEVAGYFAGELHSKGKERTARAYQSTFSAIASFRQEDQIALSEINEKLLQGFQEWMLDRGRSLNTVSFYMRNLRAICNKAVLQGWSGPFPANLFKGVFTGVAPSVKRAIGLSELQKLNDLLASPSALEKEEEEALLLFLFSLHGCGISFVDMAYLKKENIEKGVLYYKRKKTGTSLAIPLCSQMKKIMSFFSEKTKNSPYLFPLISVGKASPYIAYTEALKKQNTLLHRIGRKAGLKNTLTTHVARHTWATIAKGERIPVEVISECLGHRQVKTTSIYLASFERGVIDSAARKVSGAIRRKVG